MVIVVQLCTSKTRLRNGSKTTHLTEIDRKLDGSGNRKIEKFSKQNEKKKKQRRKFPM